MKKPAWKKFEEDVQGYFQKRMETDRMVYHRFYDTHSAGNLLPNQPADHLIETPCHTILLETKYSDAHPSLRACFSSMVSDTQIAHMQVWMRAQKIPLILFRGIEKLELWEGGHCVSCRHRSRRLDPAHMLKSGRTIKEIFTTVYLRFPGSDMSWRLL